MLKEKEFYCVKCRKKISLPSNNICVKEFKNKKSGKVPALIGRCKKCDVKVTKFIKRSVKAKMAKKYGSCSARVKRNILKKSKKSKSKRKY